MRDHPVRGAEAGRFRFVIAQQKLADFNESKFRLSQSLQCFFHLVERRDQAAQNTARFERGAHLCHVVIRIRHIEEEGVHVDFVEALLDVAQLEVHA